MTGEDKAAFENYEFFNEAVALRKWDDMAKDPALKVDPIESYRSTIQNALI
jgi:predicted HD phosphohydrolase